MVIESKGNLDSIQKCDGCDNFCTDGDSPSMPHKASVIFCCQEKQHSKPQYQLAVNGRCQEKHQSKRWLIIVANGYGPVKHHSKP